MTVAVITSAGLLLLCVIFIAKNALPDEYRWEKVLWDALLKELAERRKDRSVVYRHSYSSITGFDRASERVRPED